MVLQDSAPSWVRVGGRCRWWSESQRTHHAVVVTSVDVIKRRVVVHFEADHSVWKTVSFSHIGANGPLRPPSSGVDSPSIAAPVQAKRGGGSSAVASAPAQPGGRKDTKDGTATPPWYDQLSMAEGRLTEKDEHHRKHDEMVAQKERRRAAWQQELQKQADEQQKRREREREQREIAAEAERLRILEKLRKDREEESKRLHEVRRMEAEEEATSRVNAVWRQREQVARRQKEEEEMAIRMEEEERLRAKLEEELANRPRIAFGVKPQTLPTSMMPMFPGPTPMAPPAMSVPPPVPMPPPSFLQEEPSQVADGAGDGAGRDDPGGPSYPAGAMAGGGPSAAMMAGAEAARAALAAAQAMIIDGPAAALRSSAVRPAPFGARQAGIGFGAPSSPPVAAPRQHSHPSTSRGAGVGAAQASVYSERIYSIYQRHNPSKLMDVPGLLQKYRGSEAEMYERICAKYGVAPEPLLPETSGGGRGSSSAAKVGFARKAGAPSQPPPTLRTTSKAPPPRPASSSSSSARPLGAIDGDDGAGGRAPSSSVLLARFQNLFSADAADDGRGDRRGDSRSRSFDRSGGGRRTQDDCANAYSSVASEDERGSYARLSKEAPRGVAPWAPKPSASTSIGASAAPRPSSRGARGGSPSAIPQGGGHSNYYVGASSRRSSRSRSRGAERQPRPSSSSVGGRGGRSGGAGRPSGY